MCTPASTLPAAAQMRIFIVFGREGFGATLSPEQLYSTKPIQMTMNHTDDDPVKAFERMVQEQLDHGAVEIASALRRWCIPRSSYETITTSTTLGAVIIGRVTTLEAAEQIAPIVRAAVQGELEYVAVAVSRDNGVPWHIAVLACQCPGDIAFFTDEAYLY